LSTLISQLLTIAEGHSQETAIISGDAAITYGQFADAVKRLAAGLRQLGIEKGDRVAIMLPNVPHFCLSYYAILHLGAVVVPLNFMNDTRDIRRQLSDSGAKILITWQGFHKQASSAFANTPTCVNLIYLGNSIPTNAYSLTHLILSSSPLEIGSDADGSELAVINYTSGISDIALGAEFTHEAIAANAATTIEMFRIGLQERLIAVLPLFHPLGQTLIMHASFTAGTSLVLLPRFQPLEVIRTIQKHQVTLMPAVPGMFRAFNEVQGENLDMPSLKYCMSYGGFLPLETLQDFENRFHATILKAYGLTEAGPLVSSSRTTRDRKAGAVGLPLIGVEAQIRDAAGNILRPNQSGEVYVKSPSLMRGYHNQAAETQKRLQNGWLATGDIGYLDIDHYLFIQERKDDIIIKGGFEIFPREVERVILEFPGIDEAAVVAIPDSAQGSEVKAFIVLKIDERPDSQALMQFCLSHLPMYKCPKFIEYVEKLPKSPTGRVLKRLLKQNGATRNKAPNSNSEDNHK
jgi:long-chain acyl-CoA synthetase